MHQTYFSIISRPYSGELLPKSSGGPDPPPHVHIPLYIYCNEYSIQSVRNV